MMKLHSQDLKEKIDLARKSTPYQVYLRTREIILSMLDEGSDTGVSVSQYWHEELAGFEYLLDTSPLIIQKLREHTYHITGLYAYTYRKHHAHRSAPFRRKFRQLQAADQKELFIAEAKALGGFGHEIDGHLINLDTLKFYESLIALDKGGLLARFEQKTEGKPVVLEIGGGWGGFAYQFKILFSHNCYVIIDLPQTLLFSIIYLKTLFPKKKFFIYREDGTSNLPKDLAKYDFVFLPPYRLDALDGLKIDLALNLVSFQEMTKKQVEIYIKKLARMHCPLIYSHNRDSNPNNPELGVLSELMEQYYLLEEVEVLGVPYTYLEKTTPKKVGPRETLKKWLRSLGNNQQAAEKPSSDYRHLVGKLAVKKPGKSKSLSDNMSRI